MSTSAISSNSLNSLLESGSTSSTSSSSNDSMAKLWKELEAALKSGDLTEAKAAYKAIVKLHDEQTGTSSTSSTSSTSGESQLDKDMDSLGKALDSNNLSAAQTAFASVKQDLKNGPAQASASNSNSSNNIEAVIVLLSSTSGSSSTSSSSSSSSSTSSSSTSSTSTAETILQDLEKLSKDLNLNA